MQINTFTLIGIVSWLGSLIVLIVQGISTAMEKDITWTEIILGDFAGDFFEVATGWIPFQFVQNGFDFILYDLPFYQLLLGVGVVFFILGLIFND